MLRWTIDGLLFFSNISNRDIFFFFFVWKILDGMVNLSVTVVSQ